MNDALIPDLMISARRTRWNQRENSHKPQEAIVSQRYVKNLWDGPSSPTPGYLFSLGRFANLN